MNLKPSADLTFGLVVFVWMNLCYNKLGHRHRELRQPYAIFICKRIETEIEQYIIYKVIFFKYFFYFDAP